MPDNTIAIIILLGSFAVMTMAKMPMTFSLAISSVVTAFIVLNVGIFIDGKVLTCSACGYSVFYNCGRDNGTGGIARRIVDFANLIVDVAAAVLQW